MHYQILINKCKKIVKDFKMIYLFTNDHFCLNQKHFYFKFIFKKLFNSNLLL